MTAVFSNEEKVQILADIVKIKSVNDNEIQVANYLKDLFAQHGIESEIDSISPHRANLIAKIGNGHPVMGISGHMDVVSEGDIDKWDYPPFELTEENGKLYGRGAADMKSGLAALAIAFIEIHEQHLLKEGSIQFMATTGEEMEQLGSKQLYEKGYMDDVDALLIAEPTENNLIYANKGSMDYRVISTGKAAHSSMPIAGQNAIKPLINFVQNIDNAYEEIIQTQSMNQIDCSKFENRLASVLGDNTDMSKVRNMLSGLVITNTIFNGGAQVNSVPDKATAEFNIRTVPEYNNEKVKQLFQHYLDKENEQGAHLEADIYLDLEPALTTGKNNLVELGHQLGETMFHKSLGVTPMPGVTDASNLLRGKDESFPFLTFSPGATAHQVNEYVNKDTYLQFVDYFTQLIPTYINKNKR